jgi:RNA polymerase sporulation-specific sigma factor
MATPRGFAAQDRATTRRLVRAAQRGDPRAGDELVRRYEPLVQRVVWKLKLPPWCEREDLAQEARLGLVTAIRAWRPERGAFPALAQRCVRQQALLAVNSASRHKHQPLNLATSLAQRVVEDVSDERGPLRLANRLLVGEEIESVVPALPTLTASERAAMSGGLSGQTHAQLAKALSVTPKAASQAIYRARRKLAAALPRAA